MNNLTSETIAQVKLYIIDAFQEFYTLYKQNNIYAFVIELNDDFSIKAFLSSNESNIFGEIEKKEQYLTEKDKWTFEKWKYCQIRNLEYKFSNSIKVNNLQQDSTISKILQSTLPEQRRSEKMELLLESYKHAIYFSSKFYNLDLSQILFLIYSKTYHNFAVDYAQELNPPSSLLFEFLAQKRIKENDQKKFPMKLKQNDKDILIDLAQIISVVEPYDPLFIAHQAYLFTLEPEFIELNTHIQNLITKISTMDNQTFSLDKAEIFKQINYFYKI